MHSFVLDALDTTGADTFSHFEMLIDEHRKLTNELHADMHSNSSIVNVSSSAIIVPSRLKQLVPSVGTFYTRLPLRRAFEAYNAKYGITKRRHICISFNEIRHILNLAQIIAMIHPYQMEEEIVVRSTGLPPRPSPAPWSNGGDGKNCEKAQINGDGTRTEQQSESDPRALEAWTATPRTWTLDDSSPETSPFPLRGMTSEVGPSDKPPILSSRDRSESFQIEQSLSLLPSRSSLPGPKLLCFDGDQTLYSDGANFESNPKLAKYLYLLLKHGVTIAVVTAAGYEYQSEKYELRLSGLLAYFKERGLEVDDLERFYIFGGLLAEGELDCVMFADCARAMTYCFLCCCSAWQGLQTPRSARRWTGRMVSLYKILSRSTRELVAIRNYSSA